MPGERYLTRSRDAIRTWAEERSGLPHALDYDAPDPDGQIIRIDFSDFSHLGDADKVTWDEWFQDFDDNELVLLYEETTPEGDLSFFYELLDLDAAEQLGPRARWH